MCMKRPDAESISYKDMLAGLTLHVVLVRLVCQLNDPDRVPLPTLFSWHSEYEYQQILTNI